jgi:uncharacterized membrane protein
MDNGTPRSARDRILCGAALLSLVLTLVLAGAIAGFFYAYSASVMLGLDHASPRAAIAAMQGINATVRNAAFAPSFFGTPLAAFASAALFALLRRPSVAAILVLAGIVYLLGAVVPTFAVNVPLNDALAVVTVPDAADEAGRIWATYSARWTWWNTLRAAFSTVTLLLVGLAIFLAGRTAARAATTSASLPDEDGGAQASCTGGHDCMPLSQAIDRLAARFFAAEIGCLPYMRAVSDRIRRADPCSNTSPIRRSGQVS